MRLGAYADGRPVSFDETSQVFLVGDLPVNADQVRAYDAEGQLTWDSAEARDWFHRRIAPPPADGEGMPPESPSGTPSPRTQTQQLLWGDPERWAKTREKGFPRFLLTTGLPWAVAMFVVTGLLSGGFSDRLSSLAVRGVIWLVAGFLFALVLWLWGERNYRNTHP